jgi:hypothetical protein
MGASDPIGIVAALVLTASALYRTIAGKREALTAGLWAAALSMAIGAFPIWPDAALKSITGFDSLSQPFSYAALVISSYLIARMTYRLARIDSQWPMVFTVTSLTGMIAVYFATDLHRTQTIGIEMVPGAASAWFAIVLAIGLLPTHISAIIGVLEADHKDNMMVWLLAVYGGVGALYPIWIVVDHIGTGTVRSPMAVIYPLVWVIELISFGALALAGAISVYRTRQSVPSKSAASGLA